MEIIRRYLKAPVEILNYNKNKTSKNQREISLMGLGICEIRCLRVKISPGSKLSKA